MNLKEQKCGLGTRTVPGTVYLESRYSYTIKSDSFHTMESILIIKNNLTQDS